MASTNNLKAIIERNGISQTELANQSGLSFATVNRIVNGKQELKPNTAKLIADALDVDMSDLLDGAGKVVPVRSNSINGYLEYNGRITKINSLKELERWIAEVKGSMTIPMQAKTVIETNKKNGKAIEGAMPNADFQMRLNFDTTEEYDATTLDCWSFKNSYDVRDGIVMALGNQCSGYGFDWNGLHFHTSESMYLMGEFSQEQNEELVTVQQQLLLEPNGFTAKKKIKNRNKHLIRNDWNVIAPHWMLFVVWQKCTNNKAFAELLRSIPRNAVLIEDSTTQRSSTSGGVWGIKNKELEEARSIVAKAAEAEYYAQKKRKGVRTSRKGLEAAINNATSAIHHVGTWSGGKNLMGKILKMCQLSLLDGFEPPINYRLLNDMGIYIMGKRICFE